MSGLTCESRDFGTGAEPPLFLPASRSFRPGTPFSTAAHFAGVR